MAKKSVFNISDLEPREGLVRTAEYLNEIAAKQEAYIRKILNKYNGATGKPAKHAGDIDES